MPELPEVEIARRHLLRWFEGRTLRAAQAEPSRTFRGQGPKLFAELSGALTRADRRGKYLLLHFDCGSGALVHLGMTGKLVRRPVGHLEPYSRARWVLDDGFVIHLRDPRRFGRIWVAPTEELTRLPSVRALGRDPWVDGLTVPELVQALGASRQELKVALMDQSRIAGLGNIHAAEALFRAGLHPARKPASLGPEEWRRLKHGVQAALRFALEQEDEEEIQYVEEPGSHNPFLVYGRAGEPCSRCGAKVRSTRQGGRTTYFCVTCQPRRGRT